MKPSIFHTDLWLPRRPQEIFPFFADARNLETITPPWLKFHIIPPLPVELNTGSLIDYRLRVHGLPLRWQSEITVWEPPHRFIDEQRRGPYRLWVHEHCFEERENGTMVIDHVQFIAPGGWLVEKLFVRKDIERIFAFRRQKMTELFPPEPETDSTSGIYPQATSG